jgi:hypothetical protein
MADRQLDTPGLDRRPSEARSVTLRGASSIAEHPVGSLPRSRGNPGRGSPAAGSDGVVQFHPLPPPWDDDVARLLGQIARAIHRLVERHLAQRGDDEPVDLLAAEQAQAITALPWPAPPSPPKPTSHRAAFLDGYSLHADRFIDANDRENLEQLC